SNVRVMLCGGGPGSNVDCATLSFQTPMRGSLSCADRLTTETTSVRTTPKVSVRSSACIVLLLPDISLPNSFSLLNYDCPTLLYAALHRCLLLKCRHGRNAGCPTPPVQSRTCVG